MKHFRTLAGLALIFSALSIAVCSIEPRPISAQSAEPSSEPIVEETSSSVKNRVNVSFWNLNWFPGGHPRSTSLEKSRHLSAVHAEIIKLGADIIGLEEVDNRNAVEELLSGLSNFHVDVITHFTETNDKIQHQEIVLASHFKVLESGWENWKAENTFPAPVRGYAYCVYELPNADILMVFGLHLKSNREGEKRLQTRNQQHDYLLNENITMRQESIRQLLPIEEKLEQKYSNTYHQVTVLIGGDFNTSFDDPRFEKENTIAQLKQNGFVSIWNNVPLADRLTLPGDGRYPDICFDHIFYKFVKSEQSLPKNGLELKGGLHQAAVSILPKLLESYVTYTPRQCSDHRPVTSIWDFPGF